MLSRRNAAPSRDALKASPAAGSSKRPICVNSKSVKPVVLAEAASNDAGPKTSSADESFAEMQAGRLGGLSRRNLMKSMPMAGLMTCACCEGLGEAKASDEWDYYNDYVGSGPGAWKGTCAIGRRQSPVNLPIKAHVGESSPRFRDLVFKYEDVDNLFVSNGGHGTPQVNFSPGKTCLINNEEYDLIQFHFHTPSEHAFDGQRYAMEVHLVHKNRRTGTLAVVGVMLDHAPGVANPCLDTALDYVPPEGKQTPLIRQMDPMELLPLPNRQGHRPYVHYSGSLTTPPCSERVDWFVMTDPVVVGDSQVLRFMRFTGNGKTYGRNARPLQDFITFDYQL